MFPNMDAIGVALARIFEVFERIAVALESIAATMAREQADTFDQDIDRRIGEDVTDGEPMTNYPYGRGESTDE